MLQIIHNDPIQNHKSLRIRIHSEQFTHFTTGRQMFTFTFRVLSGLLQQLWIRINGGVLLLAGGQHLGEDDTTQGPATTQHSYTEHQASGNELIFYIILTKRLPIQNCLGSAFVEAVAQISIRFIRIRIQKLQTKTLIYLPPVCQSQLNKNKNMLYKQRISKRWLFLHFTYINQEVLFYNKNNNKNPGP